MLLPYTHRVELPECNDDIYTFVKCLSFLHLWLHLWFCQLFWSEIVWSAMPFATSKNCNAKKTLLAFMEATNLCIQHNLSTSLWILRTKLCRQDDIEISYQDLYVYLGSPVSHSTMKKQVANHAATKHIRKLSSILAKNHDAQFALKKVIWESAISSAILCSCETWMVKDITAVQTQYMSFVKDLLGWGPRHLLI